jgi:hypothetical protein
MLRNAWIGPSLAKSLEIARAAMPQFFYLEMATGELALR